MSVYPIIVVAVLMAMLPPLHAREQPATRAEIRLLAFQPDLATDEAYVHDPDAPAETVAIKVSIKSYLNHEFDTVMLTGNRIVITTKPERVSLTRSNEVLGMADLPDGVRSAILLFLPAPPNGKTRFHIMVIDDSKRAFPVGSFRVSNLSPLPVRIVLEEKSYDFKPGEVQLITDPPVRAGKQSGMKAFAFHDKIWHRIGSGIWPAPGTNRVVQVLYGNTVKGQVQLRAFDDVPPR